LTLVDSAISQTTQASHLKSAREHVNAAVQAGMKGDSKALVEHAEAGLEHATMAEKMKSLPDLVRGVDTLKQAITLGKSGDVSKATEHAKEAVNYLDATIAALGG
jgi:hypothetical protein